MKCRNCLVFFKLNKLAFCCGLTFASGILQANPQSGQVVAGNASITTAPSLVTINQQSDKAVINWQSFSIGNGETTHFSQPSPSSISLNRIVGQDPSMILGNLTADGQVWLVNPNGIYFGPNAIVDVSGLLATTHDISNEDFISGNYQFNIAGRADASIINEGSISINDAGLAAFVAPAVRNDGLILARFGQVEMASGTGFSLDLHGDRLIELAVDPQSTEAYTLDGEPLSSFVDNSGSIEAASVVLSANAARDIVDNVINMSGQIRATTATEQGGKIILGGDVSHGDIAVSGTLDASAVADSSADGGEIIIYGDNTTIDSTTVLKAEAGSNGGDGGFIETSGDVISILDGVDISTRAMNGNNGTWLIDPTDFTIGSDPSNLDDPGGNSMYTVPGNYISVAQLEVFLQGSDVTIQTLDTGDQLGNIEVNAPFSIPVLGRLELFADNDIYVNDQINVGVSNLDFQKANLTLRADNDVIINAPINAVFADVSIFAINNISINSNVFINGGNLTLSPDFNNPNSNGLDFVYFGNSGRVSFGPLLGDFSPPNNFSIKDQSYALVYDWDEFYFGDDRYIALANNLVSSPGSEGFFVTANSDPSYVIGLGNRLGDGIGDIVIEPSFSTSGVINFQHIDLLFANLNSSTDFALKNVAIKLTGDATVDNNISADASSYLQADTLSISSTAIGSSGSPLYTRAGTIDFTTSQGDIYLTNNSPMLGFTPALLNIYGSSAGLASISNYGETTVPTGQTFSAANDISLTANSPLNINGTLSSTAGNIVLTAANPGNLTINGSVSGNGTITLNAPGGIVSGNIPPGAIVNQAGSNVLPIDSLITTENALESIDETLNDLGLVDNNVESSSESDEIPEILQLAPELAEIIYLESLPDILPPAGLLSGIPLPDVNQLGLIEALRELYRKDYTPEDRFRFYELLTVDQVIESLRLAKKIQLAEFFLQLSRDGVLKESDLLRVLEQEGISEDEKVAYLGVYVRMRQIALHKLLEPAIRILRQNPDFPDIISQGESGDDISAGLTENIIETENGLVLLDGQAKSRSQLLNLRINNQWAFIDENGKYRVTIPVKKGQSQVTLLVNDPSGEAEKTDLTVNSKKDGELKLPEGRRIALMIGVEEYDNAIPELVTPVKDINDIGDRLEQTQAFEVRKLENPSKQQIFETLQQLSSELEAQDTLMVYYAGHGYLEKSNGRGYWLPSDAGTESPENWISNRDISRIFHRTESRQILLVSDSCYSGAFIGTATREILDKVDFIGKPRAVMGMSSGGETPVWDGGGNGNSIFAAKILETLGQGEIAGNQLYKQVKNRVVKDSPQVPGYGAMLMPGYDDGGDFKLNQN